jgi:acyl-coenzyme A thioesterase PaaI-like protein
MLKANRDVRHDAEPCDAADISRLSMRLRLIQKEELTPEQLRKLDERLQYSIKLDGECGPVRAWHTYTRYLYAFIHIQDEMVIAIAEASGRPSSSPGWWIDPHYRGQGYGNELVDLLAENLRTDGVTKIMPISIQTPDGKYDTQSRLLVDRLRGHFHTVDPLNPSELTQLLKKNLPAVDHRNEIVEEVGQDSLRMRLFVLDSYVSQDLPAGSGQVVLSGPVMMGFADTAMYACVHAVYGREVFAALVSLNVSFFRVAGAGDLTAVARLIRKGKSLAFLAAHLFSDGNAEPCAHVTAMYSVRTTRT